MRFAGAGGCAVTTTADPIDVRRISVERQGSIPHLKEEHHMNAGSRRPWLGGGLVFAALLALPLAVSSARVAERTALTATAAAPDGASGNVIVVTAAHGAKTKVMLRVRGLEAHHGYDVVVDGEVVGSLTTNAHGSAHAVFGTMGQTKKFKKHVIALSFDPQAASIAVRDADTGEDVLVADLGTGGSANGAFACCNAHQGDDGSAECEVKTPDECTAEGGTPNDATSCDPNPCPPPPIVCCVPEGSATGAFTRDDDNEGDDDDDDAVQRACVEGTTADQCTAQGGKVVSATSCDPNPCVEDHHGDDDGNDQGDGNDNDQGENDNGSGHGHGHGHHGGGD
jgi:hypothetical protein